MGIDWSRMSPKKDASRAEMADLIEQQATAFQSMPYYWAIDPVEPTTNPARDAAGRQLFERYVTSSKALQSLFDFPPCDPQTGIATDDPALDLRRRVYPITHNAVFPPNWIREAHRTFLPIDLQKQLEKWKKWIDEVNQGQHGPYLLDLYLHETTKRLAEHTKEIKGAEQSGVLATTWAKSPDLAGLREAIDAFPQITVHPASPEPPEDSAHTIPLDEHIPLQIVCSQVDAFLSLAGSWDRMANDDWKLRYDRKYYPSFQQYLDQSRGESLNSFFAWAEACCSKGFGLYLDY